MSTSYYFTPRREKFHELKSIAPLMSDDELLEVLTIKIGWRNSHNPPIFIRYNEIESVKDLKSYYESKKKNIMIIDEYDNELSWEEFENALIRWNWNNPDVKEVNEEDYKSVTVDEDGYIFVRLF